MSINLCDYVASVPNFPIEGVLFRDVTPLMQDPEAFREAVHQLVEIAKDLKADVICGPESRGFVFGAPVAIEAGIGFIPVRKPGKLPRETISCRYDLEYGSNEIHMNKDAVKPGQRVLVIDDLLATGGTAKATADLIEQLGGVVAGYAVVIELEGLGGRELLNGYEIRSLMTMTDH